MKITEGYMPYLGYQTYYRIAGESKNGKSPLVLLHGGPGSSHNYFELFDSLAEEDRAIISYDQLGCGLSATPSRKDLWHSKTWIEELIALREHLNLDRIHLLGQSWGGMMAIEYACDYQPKGIASLILSSTLPAADLWKSEQHRLIRLMTPEDQEAIYNAEKNDDYSNPAYLEANKRFMQMHSGDTSYDENTPEPLRRPKVSGQEAYVTAWGPNEYTPTGTLAGWEYREQIKQLDVPTLVTSGTDDCSTPLVAKTMYDSIPNAKWELFEKSRHMPFVDEHEKYMALMKNWLTEKD